MASLAEIEEYSRVIDSLSTVAYAQIKALLLSLDDPNPITFRDALLATYPEVMAPFFTAASEVAAAWYLKLRSESVSGVYRPTLAQAPPTEQLDATVRYSLSPLFVPEEPQFLGYTILALLAGSSQKLIANMGRDTISGSALKDPVRVGYARVPRLGCCAFCGMLASRGAVYRSASSAGSVQGRGVDASETAGKAGGQGRGLKARGAAEIGSGYHAHCRCVVVPVFPGGNNDYVEYTTAYFTDRYVNVEGDLRESGAPVTASEVLSDWRKTYGTK